MWTWDAAMESEQVGRAAGCLEGDRGPIGMGLESGVAWSLRRAGRGGGPATAGFVSQASKVWTLAGALWETREGSAITKFRPAAGCLTAFSLSWEVDIIMPIPVLWSLLY